MWSLDAARSGAHFLPLGHPLVGQRLPPHDDQGHVAHLLGPELGQALVLCPHSEVDYLVKLFCPILVANSAKGEIKFLRKNLQE